MSDKDSLVGNTLSEYPAEDFTISVPENYIIIWLDFGSAGLLNTSSFTYAYLWDNVDVSKNRFTNCTLCYNHILSLRDSKEKLFIIITDPKKPMIQHDLFLLWSRLLFEQQIAKIYVIQTKFDFTFYRYWFQFKQHQTMYFIPNETLLLEQLRNNTTADTIAICLNTGTSEIVDVSNYGFKEFFSNDTECFNYMISIRHQQMILVINSQNSNVFHYKIAISKLFSTKYYTYMFSTLSAIYILTSSRTKQIGIKQTDLFTNFSLFQKQLEQDISPNSSYLSNNELIYSSNTESLQMSLRSVSTERFFYYTNLIAQMPQTLDAKMEMIEECRQYYQNDPTEMKTIDKFDDEYYQQRSGTAIWWYSQDSFLYRRLNEACRTEDIDLIYVFRNFISDLLQQLHDLHSKFYDDIWGIPITVYRGQKMSINELNHLRKNIGKLFSTNTFLSATVELKVALIFAGADTQCPPLESVLFKYNIDTSIETKRPYADITLISSKRSEREIMFCMGTIFQIESIEHIPMNQENNKHTYWCIELKLVNENEDTLLALKLKEFEQRNPTTPVLLILGNLAKERSRISNDFCKAERYFRLHLEEVLNANDEMDYKSRTRAYRNLAAICIAKGDYAAGIEYHENVIKIILELPLSLWNNEDNQIITEITSAYVSIAKTYQWKTNDYDSAIKTYQQLLEFLQKQENPCLICITNTINAIGDIHKKQVRWSAALECYRKAYALNSDDSGFNRDRVDDAEEKIFKIKSRYPEILFLLLIFTWCYCYSFDIFDIDYMILWNLMPLSLIRLINYYFIQHATKKVSNIKLLHLRRFDALMNKVQKKFTNTHLREQKQRIFSRLYMIIPPFTYFLTEQSPLFSNKNILNKRTYFVIVATVLLAAYLPIIFVLITRSVMILFVILWLSDLNSVQCSILIILYYYCQKQLLLLLSTYIVLLESEFQLAARQKRIIPAVGFTNCLKHDFVRMFCR